MSTVMRISQVPYGEEHWRDVAGQYYYVAFTRNVLDAANEIANVVMELYVQHASSLLVRQSLVS